MSQLKFVQLKHRKIYGFDYTLYRWAIFSGGAFSLSSKACSNQPRPSKMKANLTRPSRAKECEAESRNGIFGLGQGILSNITGV